MKLTLRQLEIFLNVVESGHLTNVAKSMNLSQSAVSMSIKELEGILGKPLFDRINKKLVLNEIGRAFYKEIAPIFKKLSDIEYEFQNAENKGMIRVGASTTIVDYLMPSIICTYMNLYPDVKITLKEGSTKKIKELLKKGEIDIGFVEGFISDSEIIKEKIGVDEYRSFMKFEYFLLHLLKLWCNKANNNCSNDEHIIFKDTKLIEQFEGKLSWLKDKNSNSAYNAKSFLNTLFRYRILFDYFFFKRDKEKDEPFVAELKKDNNNISIERNPKEQKVRQILNLQLLFNFTTDFYAQHWIQSVFKWLDDNKFDNNDFDYIDDVVVMN